MIETSVLIPFLIASLTLTLSPGPDIMCVLTQSMSNGKSAGISLSLGLVLGIIVHTTLIAIGVSTFMTNYPLVFIMIKIFGAIYLFWIAYNIYKAPISVLEDTNESKKTKVQLIKQGFLMNVLNPKVTLFFLAFFPGFVNANTNSPMLQIYALGFVFMTQAFLIFTGVSLLSDKLSIPLRNNPNFSIFLKWMQIAVFIAIGVYILV